MAQWLWKVLLRVSTVFVKLPHKHVTREREELHMRYRSGSFLTLLCERQTAQTKEQNDVLLSNTYKSYLYTAVSREGFKKRGCHLWGLIIDLRSVLQDT